MLDLRKKYPVSIFHLTALHNFYRSDFIKIKEFIQSFKPTRATVSNIEGALFWLCVSILLACYFCI